MNTAFLSWIHMWGISSNFRPLEVLVAIVNQCQCVCLVFPAGHSFRVNVSRLKKQWNLIFSWHRCSGDVFSAQRWIFQRDCTDNSAALGCLIIPRTSVILIFSFFAFFEEQVSVCLSVRDEENSRSLLFCFCLTYSSFLKHLLFTPLPPLFQPNQFDTQITLQSRRNSSRSWDSFTWSGESYSCSLSASAPGP